MNCIVLDININMLYYFNSQNKYNFYLIKYNFTKYTKLYFFLFQVFGFDFHNSG